VAGLPRNGTCFHPTSMYGIANLLTVRDYTWDSWWYAAETPPILFLSVRQQRYLGFNQLK
jgi:hypothetical protein